MDVKWLSVDDLDKKSSQPGLLVVVPGDEGEQKKVIEKMKKVFTDVNQSIASHGYEFHISIDGSEDGENPPLFFIKEAEFQSEEQGIIQIVPLGFFYDMEKAKKMGPEGADFLDKARLTHISYLAYLLLKGEIEKFDEVNKEIGPV